ncbi:MAG: pantetheine-phosphate adenylyltransferase [Oscillospiraceae bacterium]|jgi:pantetheine-phosphate adenylyltransferase|nr:pantetheine-phosphate adenylyltransferase [Oscillospiraceae bacterium]
MKTAIYPGSFDPITLGHLNIIRRTAQIFERVVVCIMINGEKDTAMFSPEQRVRMAQRVTERLPNVEVDYFNGLLAEYSKRYDKPVVVKGLRAVTDFENEFTMALINKKINPELETMFLTASEKYTFLSSSAVKDVARHGGPLEEFIPIEILDDVRKIAGKGKY